MADWITSTGLTQWVPPSFSPTSIPTLPSLTLTDEEQRLISYLQTRCTGDRAEMILTNSYYMGSQAIKNLEIAIPKELAAKLRTLVGWARIAVDPYVERMHVDGFRLPGETDVNADLSNMWHGNGLDAELPLATTDALSMRRAYWLVGSREGSDLPRITVESPLNVAVDWSTDGQTARAALQTYKDQEVERAALYMPDRTIHLGKNDRGEWELTGEPDYHKFGRVPLVRMANNPRSDNRNGYSEITPELMSVIDSGCRRLMGLEASSELYSLPRILFMGASAEDFQNPNGEARKAWDAYITKINAIERDENGEVPEIVQLTSYDPSVFTRVLEHYASQAAGILAAVPQDLGLYTEGNPITAEAWNATETRRNRRTRSKTDGPFGVALQQVMQMGMMFRNNGVLPDRFRRIEVDWTPPETVSLAQASDALAKLVPIGVLPPTSDVTLKRAGFSAVERAQIEQDRGEQVTSDVVAALQNAATSARQPAQPAQQVNDGGNTGNTA